MTCRHGKFIQNLELYDEDLALEAQRITGTIPFTKKVLFHTKIFKKCENH